MSEIQLTHTIQKGDTLTAISQRYFGTPQHAGTIARLNGITDPKALQIGMVLKLPTVGVDPGDSIGDRTVAGRETVPNLVLIDSAEIPLVRAKHYKTVRADRDIRLIVIHSAETPKTQNAAESIARYFQTTERPASAHFCVDSDSIVQCVQLNDVAYAAPGANHNGIHIEFAGYAKQTMEEWLDDYGRAMLEQAAMLTAKLCFTLELRVRLLSNTELASPEETGIVTHAQVSEVFKKSTHTDPGLGFPINYFMARVRRYLDDLQSEVELKKAGR